MGVTEAKLRALADAIRDLAGDSKVVEKTTVTVGIGPVEITVEPTEKEIESILGAIDWQGAIVKWKWSKGIPQE